MSKWVTVKFYTSPIKYEKDMEKAKIALMKAADAGMEKGEVTIDNVEIKIANVTSALC